MASALAGTLSGGASGYALTHSDIGGYTGIDLPLPAALGGGYLFGAHHLVRSAELLRRWAELPVQNEARLTAGQPPAPGWPRLQGGSLGLPRA